jgi:hypothetical protein
MHDQWQGILATDSQSVLDTLFGRDRIDREDGSPLHLDHNQVVLDALCPEWDILIEIQVALRALPGVQLQYVAGHQDEKQPYSSLPLLEQLNVDADRIAEEYHELLQPQRQYVLMSPNTKAHLLSEAGTVTAKYEDFIMAQATIPPLVKYLARKFSWSDGVVDSINWKAHGQALKLQKLRRTHFVKFVHDILPTTSLQNKYDGGKRTCPLCHHAAHEDRDHILRCQLPSRAEWRQQFIHEVSAFCRETHTHPPISILLISILQRWLDGDDNPQVAIDQYSPDVSSIIRHQSRIGWHHLFQGRFAKEWSRTQQRFYEKQFPSQQYQPDKWQTGLIKKVWERWYMLWKKRNEDLYGRDALTQQIADRREVQ